MLLELSIEVQRIIGGEIAQVCNQSGMGFKPGRECASSSRSFDPRYRARLLLQALAIGVKLYQTDDKKRERQQDKHHKQLCPDTAKRQRQALFQSILLSGKSVFRRLKGDHTYLFVATGGRKLAAKVTRAWVNISSKTLFASAAAALRAGIVSVDVGRVYCHKNR
jgi:hypothetical protein